jgi:opacity protein-like surface antigen
MKANTRTQLFIRQLPLVAAAFFAAILCVSTASAGMEPKSMEIPQTEPFSWTGFYFSLDAGVVLTNFDVGDHETTVDLFNQFNDRIQPPPAPAAAAAGVMGATGATGPVGNPFIFFTAPGHSDTDFQPMVGFDVGYMKQWGHFVVGGSVGFYGTHTETSTNFTDSQENTFIVVGASGPTGPTGAIAASHAAPRAPSQQGGVVTADTEFISKRRVEETWSGYAGGQLGYAMDHWLFYATGGAAFAQIEVRQVDRAATAFFEPLATALPDQPQGTLIGTTDSRLTSSRGSVQDGWFAGCGFMYAFASNMTAGLEFRHVELGNETYRFKDNGTIFPGQTPVSVENNEIFAKITFLLGSRLHK